MSALASSEAASSQSKGFEKSSVRVSAPTPGRISGVGALVDNACGVGVADGGNQTRVEVGAGVSVGGMGVDTASQLLIDAQEVRKKVKSKWDADKRR